MEAKHCILSRIPSSRRLIHEQGLRSTDLSYTDHMSGYIGLGVWLSKRIKG